MEKKSNKMRWILVSLGLLGIGFGLARSLQIGPSSPDLESVPVGTAEDIEALSTRDDVNVLFVLVDTLREHRMSAYGYGRATTPFLTKFSQTSLRFDRHIAQSSWTKSSMASIWTGLSPIRAGMTKFDQTLSQDAELPAEILKEAGFKTVGLYRNGWVHGYFGFDQGFDDYFRPMGSRVNRAAQRTRPNELGYGNDENLIAEAIEYLRIHGENSRWFMYLHMMDLHEYIYDAESALFGNSTSDLYDNSLRRTDWILSLLHEYLASAGLLDETIIVILSDHGEAFGERGFEGHARNVLPETTETPLLVGLPFELENGAVIESMTSNVDIWPTLLDLLGLPGMGEVDGKSRVPEILAAVRGEPTEALADSDPVVAYLDQNWGKNAPEIKPAISVLKGPFRFAAGSDISGEPFETLLSIEDGQQADLRETHPEVVERLREIAKDHQAEEPVFELNSIELDEMQLDQLRALGYELP